MTERSQASGGRNGDAASRAAVVAAGVWHVVLPEGQKRIQVRNIRVNELDRLKKPRVRNPKTWDDFENELSPDAEARLKKLVR